MKSIMTMAVFLFCLPTFGGSSGDPVKIKRFESLLVQTNTLQRSVVEQAVWVESKTIQSEKIKATEVLARTVDGYKAAVEEALQVAQPKPAAFYVASSISRLIVQIQDSFVGFDFSFHYRALKAVSEGYVTSVSKENETQFRQLADRVTVIQFAVQKVLGKAVAAEVGVGLPPIP